MHRNHFKLLRYVFKRFSLLAAWRTALPTAIHYIAPRPLPASDKPALFTMNILPPMMTVWHHLAKKHLGDRVDITVFDCSGRLHASDFSGARVQKFVNVYAATKSEEFLRKIARERAIGWICDDDMFFLDSSAVDIVKRELAVPNTALVSLRPRTWWQLEVQGKKSNPVSSYCTAFNRELVFEKENLSLVPGNGNKHLDKNGNPVGRYDTCDRANEILLERGYRCVIASQEERDRCITGFAGMSGAVMLLWYFKNAEQTLRYFEAPSPESWSGNVLFGTLAGMLSICTIQELHTELTRKPYSLPSLPSETELRSIFESKKSYLRDDQDIGWYDDVAAKLKKAI